PLSRSACARRQPAQDPRQAYPARHLRRPDSACYTAVGRKASAHSATDEEIRMTSAEPFAAPVVESLSVRVVVDSVFDQFMPKATHPMVAIRSEEHTSELQSRSDLVCRLLLEKKKKNNKH